MCREQKCEKFIFCNFIAQNKQKKICSLQMSQYFYIFFVLCKQIIYLIALRFVELVLLIQRSKFSFRSTARSELHENFLQ